MTPPLPVHEKMYQAVARWLERFTDSRFWQLKVVGLALLVCLCAAFPDYQLYRASTRNPETWRVVKLQLQAPFTAIPDAQLPPPDSNESKRVFRLFMPVVGHLLHLERVGLLVVQNLMGVLFLWVTLALAGRATGDRLTAIFFVLATALTFPALWFFNCFSTNLDAPGYLLLAAAMLVPQAGLVFGFSLLATFVDERVFACLGFVVLWWKLNTNRPEDWTWRRLLAIDRYTLAVVAAVVLHALIRYYLTVARGFHLPVGDSAGVGFANLRASWMVFSPSILAPFKGLWLFAVLAAVAAAAGRRWWLLLCVVAVTGVMLGQSFMVGDHTRSLAYGFPLIIVSLKLLKELDAGLDLRRLAALAGALCLLLPSFNVTGGADVPGGIVNWFTPILPKILRWVL